MEVLAKNPREIIENCFLHKLSVNYDEREDHPEYLKWHTTLKKEFGVFQQMLGKVDLTKKTKESANIVASLIILFYELKASGPWQEVSLEKYYNKLNEHFYLFYKTNIESILTKRQTDDFDVQEIFGECLLILHGKVTSLDFKKYPCLVEVYCFLMDNIKDYNVVINPATTLPISLFLIDDYIPANKIKGLRSCSAILNCLKSHHFAEGNYYEVVYGCLKKLIINSDLEITKLAMPCILQLLTLIPPEVKMDLSYEVYSNVLDQIHTEANLRRKSTLLNDTIGLIKIIGINSAKKNVFKTIVCDNLDMCREEGIADVLLLNVLECLSEWIKVCWCVWQIETDQKLFPLLLKCLYVHKDTRYEEKLINIIVMLVKITPCNKQINILKKLEKMYSVKNGQFHKNIEIVLNLSCQ